MSEQVAIKDEIIKRLIEAYKNNWPLDRHLDALCAAVEGEVPQFTELDPFGLRAIRHESFEVYADKVKAALGRK